MISVDFLEQFVVRIDYPNRTLEVIRPGDFRPTGKELTVPVEKVGYYYTARGTLHSKGGKLIEGRFVLDIGVRQPLIAATPFVDRNNLITALGAGPRQTVGGGLGGESTGQLSPALIRPRSET